MGPLGNLGYACVGIIAWMVILAVCMVEHDRRFYKKRGKPFTRRDMAGVAMIPLSLTLPVLLILGSIAFAPSASAAEVKRIPTGVVTLQVQPDTHFDVTCADGVQLGFVTDGTSEGHGYCAPLSTR